MAIVANRLTLNVSKTHYMIFHRSRIKTVDHDLMLNGNVVKRVRAYINKVSWYNCR